MLGNMKTYNNSNKWSSGQFLVRIVLEEECHAAELKEIL